ncbi:carbon-nitrogen hydrolase family protein [Streptomyces antibioticus]|uniref:carbon-nitrogen hydrolase family protein n=1 Tax=Streptomyces antibioticus TaxID=1890 RepID=UPI00195FC5C3|nr:carbon-nitrogen hydrolase family protein [Streptomyces sp. S9]
MSTPPADGPLPATPLRVAAVQSAARPLRTADNARAAAARAADAAHRGARLVVLPELHLSAYDLPGLAHGTAGGRGTDDVAIRADASRQVTDPRLTPLAAVAVRQGVTVVVGAAVRHPDGRLTNSLLAVHPGGAVTVPYDKQHLWHDEEAALFTPGTRDAALTVDGWRLGLGVCYDMSFPEHARAAALAGAHALLYPAAFAAGTEHRAAVYLRARALENTVHTVFANPVEGPRDRPCAGTSAVYGPDGGTLSRAPAGRDTTILADLDPENLARVRGRLRMLAECRASTRPVPG